MRQAVRLYGEKSKKNYYVELLNLWMHKKKISPRCLNQVLASSKSNDR